MAETRRDSPPAPNGAKGLERVVRGVDGFQQRHRPVAVAFAVVKKFGDDRGSALAALFAYYAFLGLFPLLLLLVTVLGVVLRHDPSLQTRVLHSALSEFPIIGDQLGQNIHSLKGRGAGLVFGALGLVWGSLGIAQVGQFAMAQVWNVKGVDRPGFLPRLGRSVCLLGALGVGICLSTALAGGGGGTSSPAPLRVAALAASVVVNVALFVAAFRILTPKQIGTRPLLPGAAASGVVWSVLQGVGGFLVAHNIRHASQVYGFFGIVLGLLSFLSLAATLTLYAAEANVVWSRHLWPRSIVQPPLTEGDKQVLSDIAGQEERRPEQEVDVRYADNQGDPDVGRPVASRNRPGP
jgi:YihY family inner membrane protein